MDQIQVRKYSFLVCRVFLFSIALFDWRVRVLMLDFFYIEKDFANEKGSQRYFTFKVA